MIFDAIMPRIRNLRTPEARKSDWIVRAGDPRAIFMKLLRWESQLSPIYTSTTANIYARFILDMYLCLNAHLDATKFAFHKLRFWELFSPPWPPPPLKPPVPDYIHHYIELLLWSLKYKHVTRETVFYKTLGKALKTWYDTIRSILAYYRTPNYYIDLLFEILGVTLGRTDVSTFVGFAIVGVSVVAPGKQYALLPTYNFEPVEIQVNALYDIHVGIARVGYCRVGIGSSPEIAPELVQHYTQEVDAARKRVGLVPISSQETMFPRVFYLPRVNRIKHIGGIHQVNLQTIINRVKQYLDQKGVVAQLRSAYIMFAEEIAYFPYRGHKRWKEYRDIMRKEDIIDKYVRMGLDKAILEEIATLVT